MIPIYGHTSPETAYLVTDYPYSFKLRCRIRYWLESHPKRGFRFVSQTENPKTGRWNKPKQGTYVLVAACMFLNDDAHVEWACVTEYTPVKEVFSFAERFPGADLTRLRVWATKKAAFSRGMASGKTSLTMNGSVVTTDADREEHGAEVPIWESIVAMIKARDVKADTMIENDTAKEG